MLLLLFTNIQNSNLITKYYNFWCTINQFIESEITIIMPEDT